MSYIRMRALACFGAAALITLLGHAVFAQHIRGALEGTVYDPQEAAVTGASAESIRCVST